MSIDFEISIGDVEASIDRHQLEAAVEGAVEEMVDTKVTDVINSTIADHVTSQIESLLEEFIATSNPCSLGRSFQRGVEQAIQNSDVLDGNYTTDVRKTVRTELKSLIGNALAGSIE